MKNYLFLLALSVCEVQLSNPSAAQRCFCKVTGSLEDCACDVETIVAFNNDRFFPKLQKLLESDYFRFYKVDLNKPCPFWTDDGLCGHSNCAVKPCLPNEVPEGLKEVDHSVTLLHNKYSAEANRHGDQCGQSDQADQCGEAERAEVLGAVDRSLSNETRQAMLNWNKHEDDIERFCVVDDEDCPDSQYVDLLINPERFTGYKGPEAWRIWDSIYEENCFKPLSVKRPLNPLATYTAKGNEGRRFHRWLQDQCVEKRAFYRLVSGLHSSINIHLSARYLLDDNWFDKKWGHNVTEFQLRFDSKLTNGEGPKRLRNLYFLYLIELRALAKVLPFFQDPSFHLYTGQPKHDRLHKKLLLELLQEAKSFPLHFDETTLFTGDKMEAARLKEDVRMAFRNISRIMDCVGCFKCRLWGKVQTRGLATALKILFSERQIQATPNSVSLPQFRLNRVEIVSLFNAIGRISTSVRELENFKKMLSEVP